MADSLPLNNYTRENRFRAKLFRRKAQMILLSVNVVILCTMLLFIYASFNLILFFHRFKEIDKHDQAIMDKQKSTLEYNICPFSNSNQFNKKYCTKFCGNNSFLLKQLRPDKLSKAWSNYKGNRDKCFNKYVTVECHESRKDRGCLEGPSEITQCGGMKGSKLTTNIGDFSRIVPAVKITQDMLNKTYLANELIIYCPRCIYDTRPFKTAPGQPCYRKIRTTDKGWPGPYEFCTDSQQSLDDDCDLL